MTNELCEPLRVIPREKALELLGPYMDDLRNSVLAAEEAWSRLLSEDEERSVTLTKTARARIIHDYAVRAVSTRFDGRPGIRLKHAHDSVLVVIGTEVIIQIRHLDDGLLRSYTPTRRQREMRLQEFCLPEVTEEATVLTLGYTIDEHANVIDKIVVTCQIHGFHAWTPIGLLDSDDDMFFSVSGPKTPTSDDTPKTSIIPLEPGRPPLKKTESEKS